MSGNFGTIPLSEEFLNSAKIGIWAFELDEGKEPRMYVDDNMLGLIGLKEQTTPEKTYHAWYDNVDLAHYEEVAKAVEKMTAGEHAEVQYPWHHPDGRTLVVRCGGKRNFNYKDGVRIEGSHMDVTLVSHIEKQNIEKLKEEAKSKAIIAAMADDFDFIAYIDPDINEITVYREKEKYKEIRESIDDSLDVREKMLMFFENIIHPDSKSLFEHKMHPLYVKKMVEKYGAYAIDLKTSHNGEVEYYRFKFVSVTFDNESIVVGMLNINEQVKKQQEASALREKLEREEIFESVGEAFVAMYQVNIEDDTFVIMKKAASIEKSDFSNINSFSDCIREWVEREVLEEDVENLLKAVSYDNIRKELRKSKVFEVPLRYKADFNKYHEMRVLRTKNYSKDSKVIISFIDRHEFLAQKLEEERMKKVIVDANVKLSDALEEANRFRNAIFSYACGYFEVNLNKNEYTSPIFEITDGIAKDISKNVEKEVKQSYTAMIEFASKNAVYEEPEKYVSFMKPENLIEQHNKGILTPEYSTWIDSPLKIKRYQRHVFFLSKDKKTGDILGVCVMYDNSEQMLQEQKYQIEMEKQRNALEEALAMSQSANRAKTIFLNNMSHDIRTPMNAIIGYTGLAASHIDSKEMVQDYLKKIGQSSDHLLSLINDILDMSRIESGKMNINEKEENLSEIVHTLRNIIHADALSKELDFFIDSVDVNDEDVICDKLRLNQVLLNVLSNAVKYTQAGGTISLRIIEKAVSDNGYGSYEFRIKDNGMGMSEEFLKTIYDPFTRVKSSTVSGIQGTGLGMAITKNIVDMMGGNIDIISKEKEGTEVIINFKFKLVGKHKEPERIPEFEGLRSMVVDDDSNTCISIYRMLKNAGMRSEWCTSGKEAVVRTEAACQEGDMFKVYIIDWLMPDMNGIETTRRIRKIVGEEAPIVILTAYDWSDIEVEAREAGVTAFISKPLFPSDLHTVLEKCAGREVVEETKEFDFTGKKVLVVEDNAMNREIAEEILKENGMEVDSVADGVHVVEKMKNAKPGDYDLILMDIQMPILNGYEATKQIRALTNGVENIPIIAMTANAFEEDKINALNAGMNEHISKPINNIALRETISKFI